MNTRNIIIFFCISCIVMAENSRPPEVQLQETQQVRMWEEKLEASRMLEPEEKIKAIWLGLRNMGWRRSFAEHGEQVEVIYRKLQEELLATPGHARYLTALLDEARKDTNQPWYDRSYSDKFDRIKETLAHLPSPESVWEMGKFLEDPSDIITGEIFYERKAMNDPTLVHWHLGANPRSLATRVFNEIGLRGDGDGTMNTATRMRWWEEVKTGKRTFSFKGQAVEYRFLPDGTWETLPMENPPDDDLRKVVPVAATPEQGDEPSSAQPPAPEARDMPRPWTWIGLAGALLALAAGWRMLRRKSPA